MPPVSYILQIQPSSTVVPEALGMLLEQIREQMDSLVERYSWEGCHGTRIRYRQLDLATKTWTEGWWIDEACFQKHEIAPASISFWRPTNMNLQVLGAASPPGRDRPFRMLNLATTPSRPSTPKRRRRAHSGTRTPTFPTPPSHTHKPILRDHDDGEDLLSQICPLFNDLHQPSQANDVSSRLRQASQALDFGQDLMTTTRSKLENYPSQTSDTPPFEVPLTPPGPFAAEAKPRVLEWLGLSDMPEPFGSPSFDDSEEKWKMEDDPNIQGLSKHKDGGCSCLPTFS